MREEAVQKALANHELAEKAGTMDSEDGEKAEAKADTAPAYSRTARCIGFILLVPLSSLVCLLAVNLNIPGKWFEPVMVLLMFLALTGFYLLFRKKLIPAVAITNGVLAGALILLITVLMVIAKGSTEGSIMMTTSRLFALILPGYFIIRLWLDVVLSMIVVVGMNIFAFLLSVVLQKRFDLLKKAIPYFAAGVICIGACAVLYANRPAARYSGHGFEFMHGWSSTDFSDYMVWSNPSKLASLDHPAGLIIEDEKDMPVLDGAEACFPLYSAVAKAVYKDIAVIEERYQRGEGISQDWEKWNIRSENGKIVTFTNTLQAFQRLWERKVDITFGARPSKEQLQLAKDSHVELNITPIGKEAFVFFVEPDNPITDLTSEQIRAIYHGDITNWKELGGKNQQILAFQRPENSGSQAMMEYFMGDISLKKPQTYEYVDAMMGVLKKVAQYNNEKGAFGYSFRYFVEDLHQENDVRVIAVDGVLPTRENIENGSYPLTVDLCVTTRADNKNPYVQKLVDFMLSEDGQELVEKSGYGVLK